MGPCLDGPLDGPANGLGRPWERLGGFWASGLPVHAGGLPAGFWPVWAGWARKAGRGPVRLGCDAPQTPGNQGYSSLRRAPGVAGAASLCRVLARAGLDLWPVSVAVRTSIQ